MTDEPAGPPSDDAPRFYERYFNGKGGFTVTLRPPARAVMTFDGKGTMDGSHALVATMERMEALLAPDEKVDAAVGLKEMEGAPIRSQFLLGKWMLGRRQRFGKLAIYGGGRVEMGVARAVMKISGVRTVKFFEQEADALTWLGW